MSHSAFYDHGPDAGRHEPDENDPYDFERSCAICGGEVEPTNPSDECGACFERAERESK
jgi:hypothetical protein